MKLPYSFIPPFNKKKKSIGKKKKAKLVLFNANILKQL